jgi:hypothetical protein
VKTDTLFLQKLTKVCKFTPTFSWSSNSFFELGYQDPQLFAGLISLDRLGYVNMNANINVVLTKRKIVLVGGYCKNRNINLMFLTI